MNFSDLSREKAGRFGIPRLIIIIIIIIIMTVLSSNLSYYFQGPHHAHALGPWIILSFFSSIL